jgi:hypothetical protein
MTADIDELRRLLARATPGPWQLQDGSSWRRIGTRDGDGVVLCPTVHHRDNHPDLTAGRGHDLYANLSLIIAAVSALPWLLDQAERVKALEAARDEAHDLVVEWRGRANAGEAEVSRLREALELIECQRPGMLTVGDRRFNDGLKAGFDWASEVARDALAAHRRAQERAEELHTADDSLEKALLLAEHHHDRLRAKLLDGRRQPTREDYIDAVSTFGAFMSAVERASSAPRAPLEGGAEGQGDADGG